MCRQLSWSARVPPRDGLVAAAATAPPPPPSSLAVSCCPRPRAAGWPSLVLSLLLSSPLPPLFCSFLFASLRSLQSVRLTPSQTTARHTRHEWTAEEGNEARGRRNTTRGQEADAAGRERDTVECTVTATDSPFPPLCKRGVSESTKRLVLTLDPSGTTDRAQILGCLGAHQATLPEPPTHASRPHPSSHRHCSLRCACGAPMEYVGVCLAPSQRVGSLASSSMHDAEWRSRVGPWCVCASLRTGSRCWLLAAAGPASGAGPFPAR